MESVKVMIADEHDWKEYKLSELLGSAEVVQNEQHNIHVRK